MLNPVSENDKDSNNLEPSFSESKFAAPALLISILLALGVLIFAGFIPDGGTSLPVNSVEETEEELPIVETSTDWETHKLDAHSGPVEHEVEERRITASVMRADRVGGYVINSDGLRSMGTVYASFVGNPTDETFEDLFIALSEKSFILDPEETSPRRMFVCAVEEDTSCYMNFADYMDSFSLRYVEITEDGTEVVYEYGNHDYLPEVEPEEK